MSNQPLSDRPTPRPEDAAVDDASRREAQRLASATIHREGRRIRTLAVLTVALWLVAALLIAAVILPLLAQVKMTAQHLAAAPADRPITAPEVADSIAMLLHYAVAVGLLVNGLALLTGLLASLCTVMLALTIRRVTLRQVSESLAELSEQLRRSRRPA